MQVTNMKQYTKKRPGITNIEYGILAALIPVITIATITFLGENIKNNYCHIASSLNIGSNTGNSIKCAISEQYGKNTTPLNYRSAGGATCSNCLSPLATSWDSNLLYAMNAQSPITSYFGLYNADGTPVTTLDEAMKAKNNLNTANGDGMGTDSLTTPDGSRYQFEVQDSNGQSYGVFYAYNQMAYRNLASGETYVMDPYTNVISNVGITSGYQWNSKL